MTLRLIRSQPRLELARTADDIERIHRAGKIASLIGVEGGHMIEQSPAALRIFYELGGRYMTLTHWDNVEWADSATDRPEHDGLTVYGEKLVREMNRLGMFVDISHVSADTMRDVLRVSRAPVIFSHSSARAVTDHPRNVPDDVLRALAANGGVVHVNFIAAFIAPEHAAWDAKRKVARKALQERLGDEKAIDLELKTMGEGESRAARLHRPRRRPRRSRRPARRDRSRRHRRRLLRRRRDVDGRRARKRDAVP